MAGVGLACVVTLAAPRRRIYRGRMCIVPGELSVERFLDSSPKRSSVRVPSLCEVIQVVRSRRGVAQNECTRSAICSHWKPGRNSKDSWDSSVDIVVDILHNDNLRGGTPSQAAST